jgi:hypothetical protein
LSDSTDFSKGRLLVVAFEGWNDAGEAASGAVRTLKEQLDLYPIADIDPEDYFDYQFNRPSVAFDDDGNRELVWPSPASSFSARCSLTFPTRDRSLCL